MNLFHRYYLLFVPLFLASYAISGADADVTAPSTDDEAKGSAAVVDPADLASVVLTSRNFGSAISDGNVWLVEVYAPWCGHCVSFAPTYEEIAAHFHGQPSTKVKVGKIDGDAERALSARFNVNSYPSFFVIDGWSVYSFEQQGRSKATMVTFVQGGYKEDGAPPPLPFYLSPLGPVGLAQGTLIQSGFALSDMFLWLQDSFGLSPIFAGMVLFGSGFVGCFIMIVTLAIALTPREKQD
mmetsp:Transcript_1834/g.2579  ORF Transcript_1834/g.2579 Transcript_1834/m.2579 type:complete len:239 (+) Transcript_1834:123-839(+)|eukprot:CAMPEP_0198143428 /NCGR_PEP_ID=MMETSP1443-20131203/7437_1 /TAXON_ID=186043 /ORGANISM="Entomoneis sp., Strain CCMP2396" /LENGTH=238 /DNA_ID=CAMNT_0043806663 /DNA_START=70 /DNA_END=786 /DNA_ORIENTATION=-